MAFSKANENWGKRGRELFELLHDEQFIEKYGGCDLWRSSDGDHWFPVTLNGLENRYNVGFRTMVSSPYGLFVGTTNQYGPKVAKKRAAGWRVRTQRSGWC